MVKTVLITGGARSGKSSFAQELARASGGPVLFVATAEARDEEMLKRIEAHRRARPAAWQTLEATTHIGSQVSAWSGQVGTVIVDCITLLLNNIFLKHAGLETKGETEAALIEKEVMEEIDELVSSVGQVAARFIIVTNEVGLGLVPANRTGRLYRDLLGKANQVLAGCADEVYLMVAGIAVRIKSASTS